MFDDMVQSATKEILDKIHEIERDILKKVLSKFNSDGIHFISSCDGNSSKVQELFLIDGEVFLVRFKYQLKKREVQENKCVIELEYDVIYNEELFK